MLWTLRTAWIGGLLPALAALIGAEPILSSDAETAIRVRVYDYAGISPRTLAKAKAVASEVLESAGARVVWADCRLRAGDPIKDGICLQPLTPADLHLRLIDRSMAEATRSRECLGYARHIRGFDWLAAAYFHQAVELERRNMAPRSVALGGIMAHEIGHLLLDQSVHSSAGIMQPYWGKSELKKIARGRMRFTPEQARTIAANVAARRLRTSAGLRQTVGTE